MDLINNKDTLGVGDHLQSKNERNIKICFFKYEVLVGGEQNCLQ